MSLSELFRDLDPKIAGPLERITEALRTEISSQIDGVRQDVQSLVGSEPPAAAASSSAPRATDGLDALEELKRAAAGIDRSTQQAAILAGLLEGAGRFSSRAAFVLIRDDGQRCWSSLGFDDAGREMRGAPVEVTNGDSAWTRIRDGVGTCGLTAEECAVFCSQFEASTPTMGALLPLSLGDQVAGYLYADRVGDDPLNITALQLLTFVAGQTLETLPVRKRSSTPTLTVAAAAAPAAAPAAEPEVAEAEPEAAAEAEAAGVEAEGDAGALETAAVAVVPEPAAAEEPPPIEEAAAAIEEPAAVEEPPAVEEAAVPVEEPAAVEEPPVVDEAAVPVEEPAAVEEPPAVEEAAPPVEEPPAVEEAAPPVDEPAAVEEAPPPVGEPAAVEEPAKADFYEVEPPAPAEEVAAGEIETVDEVPAPSESPTGEIPLPPAEEPSEVAVDEPAPVEQFPPAPAAPEPPAPQADMTSTQVVPPDDVLGPGWAFTTKEPTDEAGNEAAHEEARRLARLLVTEIKLYNEEQVDQGRRSGDIYRRLQEDIDRSRQIFEDRIDEKIRGDNDYFKDALIRILAGGDESLLGM